MMTIWDVYTTQNGVTQIFGPFITEKEADVYIERVNKTLHNITFQKLKRGVYTMSTVRNCPLPTVT